MEKSNGKEGIVGDIGRSIWENETRGRDRKGKREERGLLSPKLKKSQNVSSES